MYLYFFKSSELIVIQFVIMCFFRSNSSMGKKEMDLVNPLRHGGNSQRQFILEGHVEFAQVNKTDARLQWQCGHVPTDFNYIKQTLS